MRAKVYRVAKWSSAMAVLAMQVVVGTIDHMKVLMMEYLM